MKTHYRKVFDSPYLSAADITQPTILTIKKVTQEKDKTKKSKDTFNTAYFVETELREGEKLKPLILNAINSKTMKALCPTEDHPNGSPFVEDWANTKITVYVEKNIRFGRDIVDGLRINTVSPVVTLPTITKGSKLFKSAVAAYKRDDNFNAVLERATISVELQEEIKALCNAA